MPIKLKYTGADTLENAVNAIKSAMKYIDGSATVTFKVDASGKVSAFKLTNNFDSADGTP